MNFIGPGPRSDGRIYIVDYGVTVYSAAVEGRIDSSPQVQNALNDAGLIKTTVIWPPGFIWMANVIVPKGIINQGAGRDDDGNAGTCLGWNQSKLPMFILAQGGPFDFRDMQLAASEYGIYAPHPINDLRTDGVNIGLSSPTGAAYCFDSTSNYPIHISRFVLSGGAYGILARNHLGNTIVENGKVSSSTYVNAIALLTSPASSVTSQFIKISGIDFSLVNVPCIYMEGPVGNIEIEKIEVERYVVIPGGDIEFGPGNIGVLKVSNSNLGGNAKYAIKNAPGFTLLENCGMAKPVQTSDLSKVTLINCAVTPPGVVVQ